MPGPSSGIEFTESGSGGVTLLLEPGPVGLVTGQDHLHVPIDAIHQLVDASTTFGIDTRQPTGRQCSSRVLG